MPKRAAAGRAKSTGGLYSVHPGVRMVESWVATLKAKTGRSVEEWISLVKKEGPADEEARRDWFKARHKLGTNSAWWLAERSVRKPGGLDEDTPEGYLVAAAKYVEDQYAGKKTVLRPIYDRLLSLGLGQGKDAKACPCKTMVPLYREHVFANITPTTNTRVDLGLALAGLPESRIPKAGGRIITTGGREKKDRISHRIPIASVDEIDELVETWLGRAYELDGK